jgi:hypothetical protein
MRHIRTALSGIDAWQAETGENSRLPGALWLTRQINAGHRRLTLVRVAAMSRNIFYIIGVIVVIVIVLKLLGLF